MRFQQVALLVVIAGITGVSLQPAIAQQPSKPDNGSQSSSEPTDVLIVDDTNKIVEFDYLDTQNPVFVAKSSLESAKRGENLDKTELYLAPLLELSWEDLQSAYKDAKSVNVTGTQGLKRITLSSVPLISETRKIAAAERVNSFLKLDASKSVSPKNILLVPYRYVRVSAIHPSGLKTDVGLLGNAVGRPLSIRLDLVGTDEELEAFRKDPKFEVTFSSGGYKVQQNRLDVAIKAFIWAGYHHFLTGAADFKAWQEAALQNNAGGISLGPIAFGRSNNTNAKSATGLRNAVTRNQVLEVANSASNSIAIARWIEFGDGEDLTKLSKPLYDAIMKVAVGQPATIQTKIETIDKKVLIDLIHADLAPDVLTELGQKVVSKNKRDFMKDVSVKVNGAPSVTDKEVQNTNDEIEWETKGMGMNKVTVPKSIRVYQFSNQSFASLQQVTIIDTRAKFYSEGNPLGTQLKFFRRIPAVKESGGMTFTKDVKRRVSDGSALGLIDGDATIDIGGGKAADVSFSATTSHDEKHVKLDVAFRVKEADDRTTYAGAEQFAFPVPLPEGWRIDEVSGSKTLEYSISGKKLIAGTTKAPLNPSQELPFYGNEIEFTRTGKSDSNLFIESVTNSNRRINQFLFFKVGNPVNLRGSHLQAFTLKLDTPDGGGNAQEIAQHIGYDLGLEIPLKIVRDVPSRIELVDPLKPHP